MVQLKYYKVGFWRCLENAEMCLGKPVVPTQWPGLTGEFKEIAFRIMWTGEDTVNGGLGPGSFSKPALSLPETSCILVEKAPHYSSQELEGLNKSKQGKTF